MINDVVQKLGPGLERALMPGTDEALSLVLRKMNPEVMLGLPCLKAFREQSILPVGCL